MPRAVDPAERLRAVQDAVVTIAAQDGFRQVTMRRVAAETGASTSVVTHYVPSRDELVRSTIAREIDLRRELLEAASADRPPRAALRALVEAAVLGTDERTHRFWLAIVLGAHVDPVLREELAAFNGWWDGRVRALIAALDPPTPDPAGLLDAVAVVADGSILARYEQDDDWSAARGRHVLDLLLGALLPG